MTTLTLYQPVHTQESPARVGHWWCTICFWCSFSPGNSYWAEGLVWRWNTPGPSPYDRVERHCRPSLFYETGSLGCHETLRVWQYDSRRTCPIVGTYKMTYVESCGALSGGVLIACFLARWNRDRLWSLPSSRRRREGNNSYTGWRKFFPPYGPRGVVKNLK